MKLIIQIPCFNEEASIPDTLAALPRAVDGFDAVEWLVIDDGSTDATIEMATQSGIDHVEKLPYNQGLARAFLAGLERCVEEDADVIVNTDADNQYRAEDIPVLVAPILAGEADIVIGARPIATIQHFSLVKRVLQGLGSYVVRRLSRTQVADAPSGFRAMTRDAALRLTVFTEYTYTLETIIQAGRSNLRILSVPIGVNGPTRPSRLVKSIPSYLLRSIQSMLSVYLVYEPTRIFGWASFFCLLPGTLLALRYLYFVAIGEGGGHVQSVIAAGVLAITGVVLAMMGVIAHLLAINRRILEELRYDNRIRRTEVKAKSRLESAEP